MRLKTGICIFVRRKRYIQTRNSTLNSTLDDTLLGKMHSLDSTEKITGAGKGRYRFIIKEYYIKVWVKKIA